MLPAGPARPPAVRPGRLMAAFPSPATDSVRAPEHFSNQVAGTGPKLQNNSPKTEKDFGVFLGSPDDFTSQRLSAGPGEALGRSCGRPSSGT